MWEDKDKMFVLQINSQFLCFRSQWPWGAPGSVNTINCDCVVSSLLPNIDMCTTRLHTSKSLLLLSHPRRAICFSSHRSLHLAASALASSHSDRTHGGVVIGVTARTCSISNARWTRWLICGERNPFSLFGLNTSQHCPGTVSIHGKHLCFHKIRGF